MNIPAEEHIKQADYFGLVSGRNVDKFAETNLTAVASEWVDAPYIDEFPMNILCKVREMHEIGSHTLFVGEIMDVIADQDVYDDNGKLDVRKVNPVLWAPDDGGYYGVGKYLGESFSIGKSINKE